MNLSEKFLDRQFNKVKLLNEAVDKQLFLAIGNHDSAVYILKYINATKLLYKELEQLKHRSIPHIYYVLEKNNRTIVVQEHINAANLATIIQSKGAFEEQQVIDIAMQLCECLIFIHSHKIIHRDIKPSNILLDSRGMVYLIDFDTACKLAERVTKPAGTEWFAAPEQYLAGKADERSDIYAFGRTLQVLLGSKYHGRLEDIVNKCIAPDPIERYQTAAILSTAINGR